MVLNFNNQGYTVFVVLVLHCDFVLVLHCVVLVFNVFMLQFVLALHCICVNIILCLWLELYCVYVSVTLFCVSVTWI